MTREAALTQTVRVAARLVGLSQPAQQLWWLQTVCDGAEPARQPVGSGDVG